MKIMNRRKKFSTIILGIMYGFACTYILPLSAMEGGGEIKIEYAPQVILQLVDNRSPRKVDIFKRKAVKAPWHKALKKELDTGMYALNLSVPLRKLRKSEELSLPGERFTSDSNIMFKDENNNKLILDFSLQRYEPSKENPQGKINAKVDLSGLPTVTHSKLEHNTIYTYDQYRIVIILKGNDLGESKIKLIGKFKDF